jgi:hypothetical protein
MLNIALRKNYGNDEVKCEFRALRVSNNTAIQSIYFNKYCNIILQYNILCGFSITIYCIGGFPSYNTITIILCVGLQRASIHRKVS